MDDPRTAVKKYTETLVDETMKQQNVFACMDALHKRTVYPLPRNLAEEYEDINNIGTGTVANMICVKY